MTLEVIVVFQILSIAPYLLPLVSPGLLLKAIQTPEEWLLNPLNPVYRCMSPPSLQQLLLHLYLTTNAIYILQAFICRSRLCSLLVIGEIWEILEYSLRAASTKPQDPIVLYATKISSNSPRTCMYVTNPHVSGALTDS
jgi:hypothetical protein